MNHPGNRNSLPPTRRNYYAEFMESSRWLRKEQSDARSAWFNSLSMERKSQALFRFEMLLKGIVFFGNPVNHPGLQSTRPAPEEKSWSVEMELLVSALRAVSEQGRRLCNDADSAYDFNRFIDGLTTGDQARLDAMHSSLQQDTPNQSLSLLVNVFDNLLEVSNALILSSAVSYPVFSSIIVMAQREIHRSEYFNPLTIFEFRSEFDQITSDRVVEILEGIESQTSQRVTAFTLLSIFRLMHYLDIIEVEDISRNGFGPLFCYLALLHSDGMAFSTFFTRDASNWMAEGFGREFQSLPSSDLRNRFDELNLEFEGLKSLRELLASSGHQLQLELKKVFEQLLPAIDDVQDPDSLVTTIALSMGSLRSYLQNTVVLIAREFSAKIDGNELFPDFTSDTTRSNRLRRDVWMFQQILRAFIAKTLGSAGVTDQWTGADTIRYVKTFVSYFRSMGYQLLRYSDYEHFDRFIILIERLRDEDALEVQRLPSVVAECEDFYKYLGEMFEKVSQRDELKNIPFDKRDAAATLKLFLGAT